MNFELLYVMKNFCTELVPRKSSSPISLKDKIFSIGSCFSDEIGNLLLENKFQVLKNTFGTVYNPISIHQRLIAALNKKFPHEKSYAQIDNVHVNYHFHSSFSSLKKNELESKIQNAIVEANDFLKNANRIIITYGTAFVYKLKSTNEVVANCHKVASTNFEKELLTENEIIKSFEEFYEQLKSINPSIKIILTVSPVRHLKDTLELNSVSKSILRTACHFITNKFSDVEYFPAYEILLDDLRDYRFYKTDRLHPTEEAVEYIWEKFFDSFFDESTKKFVVEWTSIKKELNHRPFNVHSESHQKFLKSLLSKLEKLSQQINVQEEITKVKSYLINRNS